MWNTHKCLFYACRECSSLGILQENLVLKSLHQKSPKERAKATSHEQLF